MDGTRTVLRITKAQHRDNPVDRGKGEDGMAQFQYGQKVKWRGEVVTYFGSPDARTPKVAVISRTGGQRLEVNVEGLSVVEEAPVDPVGNLPYEVATWLRQTRSLLSGVHGAKVASILRGATRGPDTGGAAQKQNTTAVLRRAAWGTSAFKFGDVNLTKATVTASDVRAAQAAHGEHFANNIKQTAETLGVYDPYR